MDKEQGLQLLVNSIEIWTLWMSYDLEQHGFQTVGQDLIFDMLHSTRASNENSAMGKKSSN